LKLTRRQQITQFARVLQSELFPVLNEDLGELTPSAKRLVATSARLAERPRQGQRRRRQWRSNAAFDEADQEGRKKARIPTARNCFGINRKNAKNGVLKKGAKRREKARAFLRLDSERKMETL
jgi:hypothetical protein